MILSIETGGEVCSVALSRDGELISLRESELGRNHAKDLAVFISEIFKENKISSDDLLAVAVSEGPGSYTGLRIGVSVAKGICYAANKPLISIGSLQSLAQSAIEDCEAGIVAGVDTFEGSILCPMIDARRMEVYNQLFDGSGSAMSEAEPHIITENSFQNIENYENFYIFGSGSEKSFSTIKIKGLRHINVTQSARGMVKIAHKKFDLSQFEDVAYFEPLYLKEFVAAKPKKQFF